MRSIKCRAFCYTCRTEHCLCVIGITDTCGLSPKELSKYVKSLSVSERIKNNTLAEEGRMQTVVFRALCQSCKVEHDFKIPDVTEACMISPFGEIKHKVETGNWDCRVPSIWSETMKKGSEQTIIYTAFCQSCEMVHDFHVPGTRGACVTCPDDPFNPNWLPEWY